MIDRGTKQGLGVAAGVTLLLGGCMVAMGSGAEAPAPVTTTTMVEEPEVYYTPEVPPVPLVQTESRPEPKYVYYKNCAAAPGTLYRGDPGYSRKLDRDGDGVACE